MTRELMIDFNEGMTHAGTYNIGVPPHTREALEDYLIKGWAPGGFLTAMLTGDLYRAVSCADSANRQMLWAIGRWIVICAPPGSWGSEQNVQDWCNDKNGIRTRYAKPIEQSFIVKTLKA